MDAGQIPRLTNGQAVPLQAGHSCSGVQASSPCQLASLSSSNVGSTTAGAAVWLHKCTAAGGKQRWDSIMTGPCPEAGLGRTYAQLGGHHTSGRRECWGVQEDSHALPASQYHKIT